ncbi:hypothetical protein IWQ60_011087 [Tieghemiomyces parasiticus]|uniref:P-loop containing nucleoside triphosphate hydrolase protein n=1 Tax=Tieghemiomyces parasiticus TaxID=78921 RepID=A0A9W7ZR97_9FUNG|nr:hypothetical protein IWQ60_011087 [Tieghemiomyces parasiticus]
MGGPVVPLSRVRLHFLRPGYRGKQSSQDRPRSVDTAGTSDRRDKRGGGPSRSAAPPTRPGRRAESRAGDSTRSPQGAQNQRASRSRDSQSKSSTAWKDNRSGLGGAKPTGTRPAPVRTSTPLPTPAPKPKMPGFIPARFQLQNISNEGGLPASASSTEKLPNRLSAAARANPASGKAVAELEARLAGVTFNDLGLDETLLDSLRAGAVVHFRTGEDGDQVMTPTTIQSLAIPELLRRGDPETPLHSRRHVLCAAETGSGKTLAYLLPVIHHLKRQEELARELAAQAGKAILAANDAAGALTPIVPSLAVRRTGRPRALIVVPSRELVAQVMAVCKAFSHRTKFRSLGITYAVPRRQIRDALESGPVDLVVATPSMFLDYYEEGLLGFGDLRYLVIDEADTMLNDNGFDEATLKIMRMAQKAGTKPGAFFQCTLVSATLPKTVVQLIEDTLAGEEGSPGSVPRDEALVRITTPFLHRVPPHTQHTFLYPDNYSTTKDAHLATVLQSLPRARILVFCNRKSTAVQVNVYLKNHGIPCLLLHGDIYDGKERRQIVDMFAHSPRGRTTTTTSAESAKVADEGEEADTGTMPASTSRPRILVCTDIASRGLDTMGVSHVIMYDFPTTAIDYLHRAGRTGRQGRRGRVISFVGNRDRQLADRIRRAVSQKAVIQ